WLLGPPDKLALSSTSLKQSCAAFLYWFSSLSFPILLWVLPCHSWRRATVPYCLGKLTLALGEEQALGEVLVLG
ncbi:hypothetical protein V5O48_019111, partial [Marasmius crinis-equi]